MSFFDRNKLTFLFLLPIIFTITGSSAPSPRCPSNMIRSHKDPTVCYLFVNNASSFDAGEKFCNQNNGHLAPVFDFISNHFISDNAYDVIKNSDSFWLGGKAVNVNSATIWAWTWQNSLVLFSEWDNGQPNKNGCMISTIERALWSSEDCTVAKPFVCQIPAFIDVCDPEWTYFKPPNNTQYPDGMCYRYMSQTNITFDQAQSVCQTQNANLVSIHSEEENTFLSNLAKEGTTQTWSIQGVFIGFHYSDSKWKWLDGTNVTYDNWGPDRPLDQTKEVVAAFYPDGVTGSGFAQKWDNYVSNYSLNRFICKKKPNFVSVTEKLSLNQI